jgi:hypothetical protein
MNTLLLAINTWDLTVDASGNIGLASDPYAVAQNIATAARTFQGEVWYNKLLGIPYFQSILGKQPNAQFIRAQYVAVAEAVEGVASAQFFFTLFKKRTLSGQIQATLEDGTIVTVSTNDLFARSLWYVNAISPAAAGSQAGGP